MNIQLLKLLSDGQFHSGDDLGRTLGVSRSAIWKHLKVLQAKGFEISSVKGKGYRLRTVFEPIDEQIIRTNLRHDISLEVFNEIGSTNTYMMTRANQGDFNPAICIAESQTEGRGRRGRQWLSPFGQNLYFTVKWPFQHLKSMEGLSLAVGLVVSMSLEQQYGIKPQLKWPNDILMDQKKLAGILIEVSGSVDTGMAAIIGVGLNVHFDEQQMKQVDQPITALNQWVAKELSRNQVLFNSLNNLVDLLEKYEEVGLEPFVDLWNQRNAFQNQSIDLLFPNETKQGVCLGIHSDGSLLVDIDNQVQPFSSGEISVRRQAQ